MLYKTYAEQHKGRLRSFEPDHRFGYLGMDYGIIQNNILIKIK